MQLVDIHQDFRDINDLLLDFEKNVTVDGVPVPSRVNLQSFLLEQTSRC
jgi:hypothetical protein